MKLSCTMTAVVRIPTIWGSGKVRSTTGRRDVFLASQCFMKVWHRPSWRGRKEPGCPPPASGTPGQQSEELSQRNWEKMESRRRKPDLCCECWTLYVYLWMVGGEKERVEQKRWKTRSSLIQEKLHNSRHMLAVVRTVKVSQGGTLAHQWSPVWAQWTEMDQKNITFVSCQRCHLHSECYNLGLSVVSLCAKMVC